ncbi:MAG: hypothetical protein MJZ81_00355 [Bacteroidales bacterium]|nr:hypothetical protein [Bacteroidales bacterium]
MKVRIISPDTTLFEGTAKLLQLPGVDGLFELLNNHAPIIAALKAGTIRMQQEEEGEKTFEIKAGVVKAQANDVLILTQ